MHLLKKLAIISCACASVAARAQAPDSASVNRRELSLVGSARVSFAAAYQPVRGNWELGATGALAPFITNHWQLGIEPSYAATKLGAGTYHSGGAALLANYFFGQGSVSRPYAGLYVMQHGQSLRPGYGALGAQAGWLYFMTPYAALRAEAQYRRYDFGNETQSSGYLLINIDPYLFGRAAERLTTLPGPGTIDATGSVTFLFHPQRELALSATVAPFFSRWFQAGLSAAAVSGLGSGGNIEVFGRGYLPVNPRFAPFGDVLGSASSSTHSFGSRLGFRSYLARGVALDISYEWRHYDGYDPFDNGERRSLRASMMTQFRTLRLYR